MLTYGSLFAGIKGDRGFDDAGCKCKWAVEIDPFCQAIIRTHYPGLLLFSDVRTCGAHNLAPVDIITAGFPCQDLSVAGNRRGLDGHRSSLFWEACRIAADLRPAWLVLENVPGLFSSRGGKDFAAVLRGLGDLGCFQSIAWRVLDSRWFGVAQRRRRVFLVASARAGGAEEVLFESEGGEGNSASSTEAWENFAGPLGGGAYGTGRRDEDDPNLAYCLRKDPGGIGQGHNTTYAVAGPLNTQNGHCINAEDAAGSHIVAAAISASNGHHGHSSPRGDGSDNLVAHALSNSSVSSGYRYDPNGEDFVVATINSGGNSGGFRTEPGEHLVAFTLPSEHRGVGNGHNTNYVSAPINAERVRAPARIYDGLDSARYRALGNAWTVQVGRWIAERIVNVGAL